jgi:hypothetical protein
MAIPKGGLFANPEHHILLTRAPALTGRYEFLSFKSEKLSM